MAKGFLLSLFIWFESVLEHSPGITERLKADNALEWVGRMNNIQACAREIVDKEIIYQ